MLHSRVTVESSKVLSYPLSSFLKVKPGTKNVRVKTVPTLNYVVGNHHSPWSCKLSLCYLIIFLFYRIRFPAILLMPSVHPFESVPTRTSYHLNNIDDNQLMYFAEFVIFDLHYRTES